MEVDYKAAGFWFDVLQWLSIGVVAVWGYLRTKDRDNAEAIAAVSKSLNEMRKNTTEAVTGMQVRMSTVEERLRHMPTADEVARIEGEVSEVRAKVEGIEDLLKRVEHQTNLIHQHLLSGRK